MRYRFRAIDSKGREFERVFSVPFGTKTCLENTFDWWKNQYQTKNITLEDYDYERVGAR